MSDIKHIVELKLKHNWKMYRKFQEVDNKTAMHDFLCRINILEDILEDVANGVKQSTEPALHKHFVMPSLLEIDFNKMRKAKGLTLREVEKSTGISNAYLSQVETGKIKSPGYNTVKALLELYSNEA